MGLVGRYTAYRRRQAATWRDVAWLVIGAWGICLVGFLDARVLPPTLGRDLLYLVPLGLAVWRLGPQVGWYLAACAGCVRLLAAYARLGTGADPLASLTGWGVVSEMLLSVGEFGVLTWVLLAYRALLERERGRAERDPLTGLYNRAAFTTAVERALARGPGERRRAGRPSGGPPCAGRLAAIVYVDLDGFKAVNDGHGHAAGDEVLRQFAAALHDSMRANDLVARLGGDEFAVWMRDTTPAEARAATERACERLRAHSAERGWTVDASVGIAMFAARPPNAAVAIAHADTLMYRRKSRIKGGIEMATVS